MGSSTTGTYDALNSHPSQPSVNGPLLPVCGGHATGSEREEDRTHHRKVSWGEATRRLHIKFSDKGK